MEEIVVLSIGGSLINDGKVSVEMASYIASILKSSKKKMGIVVGGGKEARLKVKEILKSGKNQFYADLEAIKVTRKNADLLRKVLGKEAGNKIFDDFLEACKMIKKQKYVLMGGTIPGITTDTDAALLAEALYAKRLVNVSKSAIYSKNPEEKDAIKYDYLTFEELIALAQREDQRRAGTNFIFDILASKIIARSKIETHFIDGTNPHDFLNAIEGKKHNGTIVSSSKK
ncbi:MAG: UMP kinase [Candidatus Micrarchaeota archaeon]|nr:UMP kinase [Candidatus Micrarchaeota archaeon]